MKCFLVGVALVAVWVSAVAVAMSYQDHDAGGGTTVIDVGSNIKGTLGAWGNITTGTNKVSRQYGFKCSGTELETADEPKKTRGNNLKIVAKWNLNDDAGKMEWNVDATATLKDKEGRQHTEDADGPPGGTTTPTWTATADIKLWAPSTGPNNKTTLAGSVSHSYSHSGPTTDRTYPEPGQPPTPGYDDQEQDMQTVTWDVNPGNQNTWEKSIYAYNECTFEAHAEEIKVHECDLLAVAELEVTASER